MVLGLSPLEFPMTIHGVSMDIFWNQTFMGDGRKKVLLPPSKEVNKRKELLWCEKNMRAMF